MEKCMNNQNPPLVRELYELGMELLEAKDRVADAKRTGSTTIKSGWGKQRAIPLSEVENSIQTLERSFKEAVTNYVRSNHPDLGEAALAEQVRRTSELILDKISEQTNIGTERHHRSF
jgi:hypothetical protein